jgi:hypothetical protein
MNESLPPIRNPIVTEAQLALVRINEDLSKTQQSALRNLVYEIFLSLMMSLVV